MKLFGKKEKEGEDELNIENGEIVAVSPVEESLLVEKSPEETDETPLEETPFEESSLEKSSNLPPIIVEPIKLAEIESLNLGEEETETEEEESEPAPPEGEEVDLVGETAAAVDTSEETPAEEIVPVNTAADARLIVIPEIPTLERPTTYSPSYLIDGSGADYAAFQEYLRKSGKSKNTQLDYGITLRRWRREFAQRRNSHPLDISPSLLNAIFRTQKTTIALKLKYVLSSYANYRAQEGDPRLLYILTAHKHELDTPTQKNITPIPRNPTDCLTDEEANSYEDLARFLTKKGKREGIWLFLCLLGAKPSEIKEIGFPNKSNIGFERRGKAVKIKIPRWLYLAMQEIPKWRMGRKLIHRELTALGVSPNTLNEVARRREEEERKKKKQDEKDLKKMVERWRRNSPDRK